MTYISAIGIFGAFFLLLLIVADVIPQSLTSIPVFGRYLLANMILVVLAMFFSTIATSLYRYPDSAPMLKCLERVSIVVLRLFFLHHLYLDTLYLVPEEKQSLIYPLVSPMSQKMPIT